MNDPILEIMESDTLAESGAEIVALVSEYFAATRAGDGGVSTALTPEEISPRFDEPIPRGGVPMAAIASRLRSQVISDANRLYHPMYMGHQVAPPLPAAVWTESLISVLNQSVAVWEMSPTATVIEHRVIRWMTELAGWDETSGGTLTSGGTEATFTALLAARNTTIPDAWTQGVGENPPVVVCGEHAHYAVSRALGELGLGVASLRTVPSRDYRMDTDALAAAIDAADREGRTVMSVVATVGSTATGSFDDLETIGAMCDERGIWLHVDGAHGASALLSETRSAGLRGLQYARSLAWDPHKGMLLPIATGMLLMRDERDLQRAFAQRAPYLFHERPGARGWDLGVESFQCSRRADVLKLWVALQRYGADGIGKVYDHLCDVTSALYDAIVAREGFEALHEPESNILCFRHVGNGNMDATAVDELNRELRVRYNRSGKGWITLTVLDGRPVLRVTLMNHRTREHHVRALLTGLADEARALLTSD
ncbi:MAG TPA: aspartate aminotransferase family protein [Gemmatimonadaceae bacterium]